MGLTVLITSPTLGVRRCGPDEPDAAWVPFGIWFESTMPGGWKGGGFNLRQRGDQDLGLRILDEVEMIDGDGNTVYEGLIVKLPRSHGDDYLLGVECLGWAATMLFDPSVPYHYADPIMGNWAEVPLSRRAGIAAAAWPQGRIPVSIGQGGIVWDLPNEALAANEDTEIMYVAPPGCEIGEVDYQGTPNSISSVEAPTLYTADNETLASATSTALTLDDTVRTATVSTPERYAMLRVKTTGAVTPAAGTQRRISKLSVRGNNALPTVDTDAGTKGYWVDDILIHALSLGAPKLVARKVKDGGQVERPPTPVAHATDNDLGTVERIVLDLNKHFLYEWGCYHGREFFYRETNPDRLCWEARLQRGIHLALEGDDAEHALNGMMIRYTLADGTPRVAGPLGSGLDVESELLGDLAPENTVNQHGHPRKWGEQTISFPLAADIYAVTIGAAYKAQAALPARSGDIELIWEVEHPTKGMRPVREVLAGHYVRLSDHPADVPRRIINTNNREDGRQNTVTVGNDMNKVDAILEQLGVVTKVTVG